MKYIFKLMFLFICTTTTFAQGPAPGEASQQNAYNAKIVKKMNPASTVHLNDIHTRAVRYLLKTYKTACDIEWIIHNNGINAHFNCEGEKVTLRFTKKGILLTTRKIYTKDKLNPQLIKRIHGELKESFSISGVHEFFDGEKTIFDITLQNDHSWCLVKFVKRQGQALEQLDENKVYAKHGIFN